MNPPDTLQITCPYCWQPLEISFDPSVPEQSYVEDCEVCCRPMLIDLWLTEDGTPNAQVRAENA
ncbi:MAG: CPXCG motif-containing cysteine-rich protein [Verrucomicrobia bacterium]|nr:CPXCG motif-containing cysteine-rich protein [Verrucomicrobiota bacterium]MCH8514573.1 CPXCG motif-containing cysteine-rich protein [Kiritimatiellia bacterium]